ncbi:DUF6048 family protein [Arenibacter sp. GZD96]|uniref:DUF6048 family protein n=1 Tax=Aurantibrevibacter litoralis TaxID=3106030 RepID=UPI002AFFE9B2|nr:DUF6048 family protein [Arenibacter sp. GZD-96]MEA1785974.1 DUF6048 family protein [Arenibacter sp. GZD-96]
MLRYFISLLFVACFFVGWSQENTIDLNPKDTVVYKQPYGIRFGIDLSRLGITAMNDNYTGFEAVGDYRLSQKFYAAAELGNEKKTKQEDVLNFTASGSYIKLGFDYNTYENWYGMNNAIHIGSRLAFSSFSQTLNSYSIFERNRYWSPDTFFPVASDPKSFDGLSAVWIEFVMGTKVELFSNIYMGVSVRLGLLLSNTQPENFTNLWIPGFNKVTDESNFGVGFNYTLTYLLPLYKKAKPPKIEEVKETP